MAKKTKTTPPATSKVVRISLDAAAELVAVREKLPAYLEALEQPAWVSHAYRSDGDVIHAALQQFVRYVDEAIAKHGQAASRSRS